MPHNDLKQRRYILVVIDEWTRYAFGFLLRTKADAKTSLQTLLKRANVLHTQYPVKYLHHDGGGEFVNTTMDIARAELGIDKAYIPPYCHSSNGMVERLNKTIAAKVHTM
jgi:transposase InsO family protein